MMYCDLKAIECYQDLKTIGIVVSPWLAGVNVRDRFDPGVFEILNEWAEDYAESHLTEKERIASFNSMPVPSGFTQKALYETASSTAVFLAHQQTGTIYVGEKLAKKAIEKIESYINSRGLGTFLQLYRIINLYESMNALHYYGRIPEREYLLGTWHRPWIDYSLDDELIMSFIDGIFKIDVVDGHRYISLSKAGLDFFHQIKILLEESEFFKERLSQLHISQFNRYKNYEQLAQEIWPQAANTRNSFLDWSGIQPGMRVLELGCGSGPFTFEAGLAERVGPQGTVTALDPSAGMISRAKCKHQAREFPWVTFIEGKAEKLPFADNSFDAALGIGFLHFTDRDQAAREMRRVVRSGGFAASCHPLRFSYDYPFFREWFAPILKNGEPRNYLPSAEDVIQSFTRAGMVSLTVEICPSPALFHDAHKIIQNFIYGVGLFQEEMADLPYRAREELVEQLRQNGENVCQKYPTSERIMNMPIQMIRGIIP